MMETIHTDTSEIYETQRLTWRANTVVARFLQLEMLHPFCTICWILVLNPFLHRLSAVAATCACYSVKMPHKDSSQCKRGNIKYVHLVESQYLYHTQAPIHVHARELEMGMKTRFSVVKFLGVVSLLAWDPQSAEVKVDIIWYICGRQVSSFHFTVHAFFKCFTEATEHE